MIVIIVKCIGCGKEKEIKPYEISKDDQPICEDCGNSMIVKRAKAR